MERLGTPDPDGNEFTKHYHTPTKTKTKGAVEFYDRMGISFFKEDVKLWIGVDFRGKKSVLHFSVLSIRSAV